MTRPATTPRVVLLGPALHAVSGVSTHLNQLIGSDLKDSFEFMHFQVGSEGRSHTSLLRQAARFVFSPVEFGLFLWRRRPELVHINTSMVPKAYWRDLGYLAVARLMRRRVVYQAHGGALPEDFFPKSRFLQRLLRKVLTSADVVVLLAQVELRAYTAFAPHARFEVIANGIDAASLAGTSAAVKAPGTLRLAHIGRLVAPKGLFETLQAMAILRRQGRELTLTVAGGGPDEPALKALSQRLELDDRVEFAGPLFGTAKDELWRHAHVFVFPTYHDEGLPYSLLEAMAACAVPVTTRVGAIPDVLADGVQGLLIEARDPDALAAALARLDDDRAWLARMAQAGRERVLSEYSITRLARDFRRVYTQVLSNA